MPSNNNSIGNLEITSISLPVLNDRLRRIGQALGNVASSSSSADAQESSVSQLVFSVPGILAVQSNVTPLLELAADQSFTTMIGLLKTAAIGSAVTVQLYVAGVAWGPPLSIAAGLIAASVSVTGAGPITANSLIRLDITGVGALLTGVSYPGSDLTVLLR